MKWNSDTKIAIDLLTNSDCSRRNDDENGGQSNFKKEKRSEKKKQKQNRQVIGLNNLLIEMRIHNSILAQVFWNSQEVKRQIKKRLKLYRSSY